METSEEKTVVLWGQDDLLTKAVENLLGTGQGWKVIRFLDDLGDTALAQVVNQVTPDVVIIHEGAFASDIRPLIRFIQDYPELKIITIGLENNKMDIYTKKSVCIKESSDLLAAIQNDAVSEM